MPRANGRKIPGLKRRPKHGGGYFDDLSPEQQRIGEYHLRRMTERRRRGKED
jgi:hypothetical protein